MMGSSLSFVCWSQIAVQTLWSIKIAVLVKPEHENRISHVGMSSVKTGIANTLGNNYTWYSVCNLPSHAILPGENQAENMQNEKTAQKNVFC